MTEIGVLFRELSVTRHGSISESHNNTGITVTQGMGENRTGT
jgi:hypothetical protein